MRPEATPTFRLYLITDPSLGNTVERTRAALRAASPGSLAVQVRDPRATAADLLALARALRPMCRTAGVPMIVNDRVDVARLSGADGVQLPERGLDASSARAVLGERALVGRSTHDWVGLERAVAEGASFAVLGPVGAVPGKRPPIGVAGFAAAVKGLALPVYALGGVDAQQVPALEAAGAAGIAVIRAVYAANDPAAAVRALLRTTATR